MTPKPNRINLNLSFCLSIIFKLDTEIVIQWLKLKGCIDSELGNHLVEDSLMETKKKTGLLR